MASKKKLKKTEDIEKPEIQTDSDDSDSGSDDDDDIYKGNEV